VCKVALLVPLDQLMHKRTHRKLFLLVGCDGGLKSMYVVNGLKKRNRYRFKGDIVHIAVQPDFTLKILCSLFSSDEQHRDNRSLPELDCNDCTGRRPSNTF